jgi:predicted membrane protein
MRREPWRVWTDWLGVFIIVAGAALAAFVMTLRGTPDRGAQIFIIMVGGVAAASLVQALWRFLCRRPDDDKDRPV